MRVSQAFSGRKPVKIWRSLKYKCQEMDRQVAPHPGNQWKWILLVFKRLNKIYEASLLPAFNGSASLGHMETKDLGIGWLGLGLHFLSKNL